MCLTAIYYPRVNMRTNDTLINDWLNMAEGVFTRHEIQPVILIDKKWVAGQQMEVFILQPFQSG